MMIYFALLPRFMREDEPAALQAMILSAIFIGLCAVLYAVLCVVLAVVERPLGSTIVVDVGSTVRRVVCS